MKDVAAKKFTKTGLVLYFLKGSIILYIISVASHLAVTLFNVLIPRVIGVTVDSVLGDEPVDGMFAGLVDGLGGTEFIKANLWVPAAGVLLLALGMAIFRFIQSYSNTCANEKLMQGMRNSLFSHIQRLPLSWMSVHMTGDIIQRCTSDAQTILRFISNQMMQLIRIIALVALSVAVMFSLHWQLAAIAAAFVPVLIGYSLFFHSKVSANFRQCDEQEGVLSTYAQENFTGVRVVRAFGREKYERDKFEKQNSYYTGLWVRLQKFLALFWTTSDFVAALQLLFIIGAGTVFCIGGSLTEGEFIAFVSYNAMLVGPVRQLGRIISDMSKAGVALGRINEIMNAPAEVYGEYGGRLSGEIKFEHVTFGYEKGKNVLTDVSFTVPAGSTLGIIGGTGSGKSTIAYLLDGLYLPDSGEIYVGGKNIRDISLKTLRGNIGPVLQDGYLYTKTIAENIAITSPSATRAEIVHAAEAACIDGNIRSFANGYDTVVGERGVTLSGGQKQRVSIARTLMRDVPILIFDDSLSAVDSETDVRIRKNLAKEFGGATVIIISHRITTVMNADKIIVMDKGRIAEQGSGKELYGAGGIYRRIFDMQMSLPDELGEDA